ncbi:MAG: hypothetical protein ABEJ07_01985 [Candidatus Nanohaloarchaea archaeon]
MRPSEIESLDKVQLDGDINGESFVSEDVTPNEAYSHMYRPVLDIVQIPYEERFEKSGHAYDSGDKQVRPEIQEREESYWQNVEEGDISVFMTLSDGEKYEFSAIPRTDIDPSRERKPPSFMELRHSPEQHRTTAEEDPDVKRLALRYAMRYIDEFLDTAFEGRGLPRDLVHEIDLLTAFYRDGGVHEQLDRSSIDFSPVIRPEAGILEDDYGAVRDVEGVEETVPYVADFLTDDFSDAGLSPEEHRKAGEHIGTCNALGLSFRNEREAHELIGGYHPQHGRYLANIDPEGGIHTRSQEKLEEDRSLFLQQMVSMDDRKSREGVEEVAEDVEGRAKNSKKDWDKVLSEQLPDAWSEVMPDSSFVGKA